MYVAQGKASKRSSGDAGAGTGAEAAPSKKKVKSEAGAEDGLSREEVLQLITYEESQMESALISGIAFNRDEAKLTITGVPDLPGVAFKILGPIAEANIEVDMIVQNIADDATTDLTFTVHRNDYQRALGLLEQTCTDLGARKVTGDNAIVKVSIVGVGMRSHAGIASTMFKTLAQEGINIRMIATSEIKISVVVDEKYLELAVRALHAAFELDKISA